MKTTARNIYQIIIRTWERFNEDGCFYRASAIAYAIVLSAIPLMTVLVKWADVDQDTIRAYISRFMGAYGIQDASEFLRVLDEILKRATVIAGVGTIFMVISATSILRHIEDSFNHIVRAGHTRPIHYRFALYISGIIIVPAFTILTAGGMQFLFEQLQPPMMKSVALNGNTLWVLGKELEWKEKATSGSFDLRSKIDRRATFKDIYFDMNTGKSGRSWEILDEAFVPVQLETKDLRSVIKMDASAGVIYIIGERGSLFFSKDNGRTFDFRIFAFKVPSGVRSPIFEDLIALPDKRVLILATVGSRSCVIEVAEETYSVQFFNSVYNRIFAVEDGKRTDLYVTGSGRIRKSENGGADWSAPIEERYGDRALKISAISRDGKGRMYFAGGAVWIKDERGTIYPDLRSTAEIYGMEIDESGKGFVYGEKGLFRYTQDGGRTWFATTNDVLEDSTFYAHRLLDDKTTVLVGDNGTYMRLGGVRMTSEQDRFGNRKVEFQIKEYEHASNVLAFVLKSTVWLLAYGLLFFVLFLQYRYVPIYRISQKSSMLGAWVTATALLGFLILFQMWVTGFTDTGRLYGVWAVIPIGMMLLLFGTQILFFGLELACVLDERINPAHFAETSIVRLSPPLKTMEPVLKDVGKPRTITKKTKR